MRGIEDMGFTTTATRDGKWVGRVREFPDVKTRPMVSRLDAISEVVSLTRERLRDIHESMGRAAGR